MVVFHLSSRGIRQCVSTFDLRTFPFNRLLQALLRQVNAGKIDMFHASWAPGHNSTDYSRYYASPSNAGEVYKVSHYQAAYEPYVIFRRDVQSWSVLSIIYSYPFTSNTSLRCDERFVGYGANKAACLFEMYLSGTSFYVLADHFLIHQRHPYEEETRKLEVSFHHAALDSVMLI
jgi:hypothetical protein